MYGTITTAKTKFVTSETFSLIDDDCGIISGFFRMILNAAILENIDIYNMEATN